LDAEEISNPDPDLLFPVMKSIPKNLPYLSKGTSLSYIRLDSNALLEGRIGCAQRIHLSTAFPTFTIKRGI